MALWGVLVVKLQRLGMLALRATPATRATPQVSAKRLMTMGQELGSQDAYTTRDFATPPHLSELKFVRNFLAIWSHGRAGNTRSRKENILTENRRLFSRRRVGLR